jgi:sec-independent protein translocase protein TatA
MPNGAEWFIVLAVVLLLFGGAQLPKLARNIGKAQKEFKDGLSEGQRTATDGAPNSPASAADAAAAAAAAAKAEEVRQLEQRIADLKDQTPKTD